VLIGDRQISQQTGTIDKLANALAGTNLLSSKRQAMILFQMHGMLIDSQGS
jgi:hypothetical protein